MQFFNQLFDQFIRRIDIDPFLFRLVVFLERRGVVRYKVPEPWHIEPHQLGTQYLALVIAHPPNAKAAAPKPHPAHTPGALPQPKLPRLRAIPYVARRL